MADESKKEESKKTGWLKGAFGAIAGLASGAAMMYVSPLVDRVVKPPRPLANFAVETDGLTAIFHNRFAGEGWWDFGDGSPLEPAMTNEPTVSHTYSKAGTYTAKLLVRNYIGDEHERSVGLDVTVASANSNAPSVAAIDAVPLGGDRSAPASFRLLAQTANAECCLLDLGDDRQPEVIVDSMAKLERIISFSTPGDHVVQLTALNGKQALKRTVTVHVDAQRPDVLVAHLHVTDRGIRNEKQVQTESVPVGLTTQSASTLKIDRQIAARNGFTITDAKLGPLDSTYRNVKAEISKGGKIVHVTGELTPTTAMRQSALPVTIPLQVTQERQSKLELRPGELMTTVKLPGSAVLPLPAMPADCVQPQRSIVLELHDALGRNWIQPLQTEYALEVSPDKHFRIRATQAADGIHIDVSQSAVTLTSHREAAPPPKR